LLLQPPGKKVKGGTRKGKSFPRKGKRGSKKEEILYHSEKGAEN